VVACYPDSSIAVPKSKFVLYSQADSQSGEIHLLSDVEGCQLHLDKLEHSADHSFAGRLMSKKTSWVQKKHCAADEVLADVRSAFTES
jgi:hypothetical protein